MTKSYTSGYLYRYKFYHQLLCLIIGIGFASAMYHMYLQEYTIVIFKLLLALGAVSLLQLLTHIPLERNIHLCLLLCYSIISICMNIDTSIAIWMLSLPVFSFALLRKHQVLYVNGIGFIILFGSLTWQLYFHTDILAFTKNLLLCYLVLAYACIVFHRLIVHYREDLIKNTIEKRDLQTSQTLSAGIAHLINNQMAVITGYTSLLEMNEQHDAEFIQAIGKSSEKVSQHVNDLLAYSEQAVIDTYEPINLETCIESCLDKMDIPSTLAIHIKSSCQIPTIEANQQQMTNNVFDSVLLNAIEAKPDNFINIQLSVEHIERHATLQSGDYIHISIIDDGEGMEEQDLLQAFHPFYSTKFTGRGMGLAAALGAVKRHQGHISLQSIQNVETVCHIWLPITQQKTH